ncbi:hypothetical protein HOU04_gp142 [Synechococcus phage S-T4]|uniref:Uncharacterized protein n=1 Tax=Synechococcus phage S-T4 TaxID=2268578 RepID=A0A385EF86_9CAUD|nr:hypothetical protein HOU04_gp142 [Synechococcus phage S-T4]AXQ70541.1 hypothetical protein [Synechococcus phage S-T4]
MRNATWDGHYYQYKPDYQTIDLEPFPQNQLPTITISGQEIPIQQELPNTQQEPLEL